MQSELRSAAIPVPKTSARKRCYAGQGLSRPDSAPRLHADFIGSSVGEYMTLFFLGPIRLRQNILSSEFNIIM